MLWLRKFSAIMLLSTGIALALLPFPERLTGEKNQDVIYLEVQAAPFSESAARSRFGDAFVKFSYEGLTNYPEIRDAVLSFWGMAGLRCVAAHEWTSLLTDLSQADGRGMVFSFRDGLYRIINVEKETSEDEGDLVCFEVEALGAYDNREWNPFHHLESRDMDKYPGLNAAIARLATGPVPVETAVDVPSSEWRRFHSRLLDNSLPASFVARNRLFTGIVRNEPAPWSLDVPWLRPACLIAGIAVLLLGAVMWLTASRAVCARSGIPVISPWIGALFDVIMIAISVFFVTVALDTLWVGPLGQKSLAGLEPQWLSHQNITGLHFVSILVVFIGMPLFSLWVTSLSAQRIVVDDKGVTSLGALGKTSMAWTDLQSIRLRDQRNPFAFTVMDFRRIQRVLDLENGEGRGITINEPSSRRRKQMLRDAFERHMPESKQNLIRGIEKW